MDRPGFQALVHDVTEPFSAEVDEIYNLACPASPLITSSTPFIRSRLPCWAPSTCWLLPNGAMPEFSRPPPARCTAIPPFHPQPESYWGNVNPAGPRSCYDEGKRCAETLFMDYHRTMGVDVRVIRIFNTYGPRMTLNDGRVVSNFIVQALKGEDLTIYGTGRQTRSFQYVDDLVEGMVRMMAGGKFPRASQPRQSGRVHHAGTGGKGH